MRNLAAACLALLLLGATCQTLPVRSLPSPAAPETAPQGEFVAPTPSWPQRWSPPLPADQSPEALGWRLPSPVDSKNSPALSNLPLPGVVNLPVKTTGPSRSWTPAVKPKTSSVTMPSTASVLAARSPAKPATADGKSQGKDGKGPVAATPQPVSPPVAASPPTAASRANLLPSDKAESQDFRWQDVNAVAGDAVTLHFDKANWLYLDAPAQQKTLGFQSISRDKDATTFQFRPTVPGDYVLEFQRQDLVNQATDLRKVRLTVVAPGTRTSATSTAQAPQISTKAANDALEASRLLAAAGKTAEAVQKLLQTYKADDARVNLELARLLNQGGQDDEALSYLDKNLTLTGPDYQGTLELGTKLAALKDPQKKLPAYVKLWLAGTAAPPEDLYLQVFQTLRAQKLPQAKDWSARYAGWFAAPQQRDQYLYQVGQMLEEAGDGRDVRGAWKAYDEVVRLYPLSPVWKAAGERASYLNRHFLQVR